MTNEMIIKKIYETLENRKHDPIDSYTSNIMQNSDKLAEDKILEKIGEETAEVLIASKNNENLVQESADLIFHTLLLLVYKGISLDELLAEFEKRHK
jgi:phosphoribosyl-ATP pyrophosphohydrolase